MKASDAKTDETKQEEIGKLIERNKIFAPASSKALLSNRKRPVKTAISEPISATLDDTIVIKESRKKGREEEKSPEVKNKRRISETLATLGVVFASDKTEDMCPNPLHKRVSSKVKGGDAVKGKTVSPLETLEIK